MIKYYVKNQLIKKFLYFFKDMYVCMYVCINDKDFKSLFHYNTFFVTKVRLLNKM